MANGAILFDFDGTLVDTRQASWELFAETNERFGLGVDTRDAYFEIFQGNFHESFEALSDDKDLIREAKTHFESALRDRYRPSLIPGIVDVIKTLTPTYTLAVVSSNAMPIIRRCLEEADVATCFGHVFSGDVDRSKSAVIRRFMADQSYATLRHCVPAYVGSDPEAGKLGTDNVFMVTDTVGDVEEAARVGIRAVGVCWGMHDGRRLLAAGAEAIMVWPQELVAFFGAAGVEAPESCRIEATPTGAPATAAVSCKCGSDSGTGSGSDYGVSQSPGDRGRSARLAIRLQARQTAGERRRGSTRPRAPIRTGTVERELIEALTRTAVP